MRSLQNIGAYLAIPPISTNTGAVTCLAIDTCPNGVQATEIMVLIGFGVVGSAPTVGSVGTSTTANGTYTAISGADWTATLAATTAANNVLRADINWEGRGRYCKVALTTGSTTLACAWVLLGGLGQTPNTASEAGAGVTGNTSTTCAVTTGVDGAWLKVST